MRYGLIFVSFIGAILWMESAARSQNRAYPNSGVTSEIDRGVVQAMIDAQLAIKQQQYAPAVTAMQSILDHPEDYFLRRDFNEKNVAYPGVRARTQRILSELPAEGRAAYELQFGATARARLTDAMASDHLDQVAEVVRRYQMTAAGLDAMRQLAASSFDHDELVEAALLYEGMIDHPASNKEQNALLLLRAAYVWQLAGQSERSISLLENLRALDVPTLWQIGAQKLAPYQEPNEAADWLSTHFGPPIRRSVQFAKDWDLPRGGPSGNESASVAYPVGGTAWAISALKYSQFQINGESNQDSLAKFDQLIHQVERSLRDNSRLTQPAAIPLVVGSTVVYRTLNEITAVDLLTGELQWRSSMNDGMLAWMFQTPAFESDKSVSSSPNTLSGYLRHKLFRDQLCGSLSSDGELVYAIEGSDSQFLPLRPRSRQRFGGPFIQAPTNKLVAYDLKTGRISWEVGGLSGTPPVELSGLFFVGPPLPYGGRLYCLAEVKDELCLICLAPEADSVRLEFSQTLIGLNPVDWIGWPRRHAGLTPTVTEQIMICPTANGSVVAYDLLFRQLRWGYSYETLRNRSDDEDRQLGIPFNGISFQTEEEEGRWIDGGPIICEGRVIVTPRDSSEIHCLNLVDGSLKWKRPRSNSLFVACVDAEKVYVVGRSRLTAWSLQDGTEVVNLPINIPEPSGRGVRVGSKYLLPLSTGEIATFDLSEFQILGRTKLAEGRMPGNLAIGNGTLVSCGLHDVISFQPMDRIEQKIRTEIELPDNAAALALRGEMRLHQGEQVEAVRDLRDSISKRPDPQVKRVLAGTMLNLMRQDPKQLLNYAEEMDQLTDDPRQKTEFLRLYSAALNDGGNPAGAVRQLFRLSDIPAPDEETIFMNSGYSLSVAQAIRSQLLTIYETANAENRLAIEKEFERRVDEVSTRHDPLLQFIKLVSGHPAAEPLLLKRADSADVLLDDGERTRILLRLSTSSNQAIAGPAVARLARRSLELGRLREARPWIEELRQTYREQVCLGEQTGKQLAETWSTRDGLREAASPAAIWPTGPIDFERSNIAIAQTILPVEIVTHAGRHFVGWSFEIDPIRGILFARDESLRLAWQLPVVHFRDATRNVPCQLHIRGHRMAFSMGTWLVVMESTDVDAPPQLLFEKALRSSSSADWRPNEFRLERRLLPTGRRIPFDVRYSTGFLIGISDDALFYQLDNRLHALDLETGHIAWTRVGPQFAKSDGAVDQILTLHTDSHEAILLRPLDGKELKQRRVNRTEKLLWFWGTQRLTFRHEAGDQQILEMRDVDADKTVWKIQSPIGSLHWIIDNTELAILETTGKFSVVSMETGQTQTTARLPTIKPYGSGGVMAVQRYGQRYLVVAGSTSNRTEMKSVVTLNSDTSFSIDGNVIAVDRQSGEVAWTTPVDHQGYDYSQPANIPILVLAAQHAKIDRLDRGEMNRLSALVLDKQTGRTLYSTQEALAQKNPVMRLIPKIDEHKLIVDFQAWNLVFQFSNPAEAPAK